MPTKQNIIQFFNKIFDQFRWKNITLARGLDEIEAIFSVFLAITIAHFWRVDNIGWAAFTGYMVIRAHIIDTIIRCGFRILGTLAGAIGAYYIIQYIDQDNLIITALCLITVSSVGVYFALTSRFSYAWLFLVLTYTMVVIDALGHPFDEVLRFAQTRVEEVVAGVIASLCVALCSHFIKPYLKIIPHKIGIKKVEKFPSYYLYVLLHSFQAMLALTPLPFLKYFFDINDLSQAAITIVAVLVVPLTSIKNTKIVSLRNLYRFLGCFMGGLVALISLPLFHLSVGFALLFLCVGIFIGRHIENSGQPFNYIGTQFSLIFIVVMLPDTLSTFSFENGLSRFLGIIIGIILLQLSKIITHPIKMHIVKISNQS